MRPTSRLCRDGPAHGQTTALSRMRLSPLHTWWIARHAQARLMAIDVESFFDMLRTWLLCMHAMASRAAFAAA